MKKGINTERKEKSGSDKLERAPGGAAGKH